MFYKIQKALLNFTKDEKVKAKKNAELDLQYGKINKDERDKQIATADDEPYIKVLQVEFDQKQPNIGSFELDWNEPFIETLAKAGYTGKSPEQIIDTWFNDVCRNILMEDFNDKNFIADAPVEIKRDDGKTEKY
jgi:hypothetical protein